MQGGCSGEIQRGHWLIRIQAKVILAAIMWTDWSVVCVGGRSLCIREATEMLTEMVEPGKRILAKG